VGLPNVGKSTIFNALTAASVKVEAYPFTTIEPNKGIVAVPDERLEELAKLFPHKRKVPTTLEFVDIAGLVKGAHRGEGLGNQFLAEIRNVDAIVHIVRCFEDPNVAHPEGSIDPKRDVEIVELELLLKDLETTENALEKLKRKLKAGDKKIAQVYELFNQVKAEIARGVFVKDISIAPAEALKELNLLTAKPVVYLANVGDEGNGKADIVKAIASERGGEFVAIAGKLEAEISEIETQEEQEQFRREWGILESGLDKLIKAGYKLLGLITFFTTDGPEVRAWTVAQDTKAPQAGGVIHSDFQRRFIQAEVVSFQTLLEQGSLSKVKETGLLRREGAEYKIKDGDVIHFIVS
jgi:hypothetical protein